MYQIVIKREAFKELQILPKRTVTAISHAIDKLSIQSRPAGSKKLRGNSENLWRIRVGDYRVIYQIDDAIHIIEIRKIGHRRDIYE